MIWGDAVAVVCDALSVVIAVTTLEAKYPGGLSGYRAAVPNSTYCCDETLTRVGFMHPNDVGFWIGHLEDHGLTFVRDATDGGQQAVDMAVIDQMSGPTCTTPWVTTEFVNGTRWAWLSSEARGDEATPPGWTDATSRSLNFHANEEVEGMPILRKAGIDQTLDMEHGHVQSVGRPFAVVQLYDEAIQSARQEAGLRRWDEAYQHLRRAEGYQELTPIDMLLAARIAYRLIFHASRPRYSLIPEALRRARESTEFGEGANRSSSWFERARLEVAGRELPTAKMCIDRALELNPQDPFSHAERGFIGFHLEESLTEVAAHLAHARALAKSQSVAGVEEYVRNIERACGLG